jgi:hypothetical protein
MQTYTLGKGRKKVVGQFTMYHGLWMSAIVLALMLLMMLAWLSGIFRLDDDAPEDHLNGTEVRALAHTTTLQDPQMAY